MQGLTDLGLGQGGEHGYVVALVVEGAQRIEDRGAGQLDLGEHVGGAMLKTLERADHHAELFAFLEISDRQIERTRSQPGQFRRQCLQ